MATHFIAVAGLHGYLPNFHATCDTYTNAMKVLADLHELGYGRLRKLKRDGYIELNLRRDGNEYCEIVECNCNNPECHNDD